MSFEILSKGQLCNFKHTTITPRIRRLKSEVLKQHFLVKNDGEKWFRIFHFKILLAPRPRFTIIGFLVETMTSKKSFEIN